MAKTFLNTREERELKKVGSIVITRDHHDYLIEMKDGNEPVITPIKSSIKVIASNSPDVIVLNSVQARKIENGEVVEIKTRKGDFAITLLENGEIGISPLNPITEIIFASEMTR